jgi:hypothetical protein
MILDLISQTPYLSGGITKAGAAMFRLLEAAVRVGDGRRLKWRRRLPGEGNRVVFSEHGGAGAERIGSLLPSVHLLESTYSGWNSRTGFNAM